MFTKTNLISTLVTALWSFLGGWILWGIIGDPILKDHVLTTNLMKDMPDMGLLALGCLIEGFVITNLYAKWSNGTYNLKEGGQFGVWIGLLIGLGSGLIDHSTSNLLDFSGTLINAVIYAVHFAIMGVLASIVFKKTI